MFFVTAHVLFWPSWLHIFSPLKLLAVSEILTSVGHFVEININEMAADSIVWVETNAFIINGIEY